MKCPICGNPLRPSKKDPEYGLCDNCRKKFKLKNDNAPAKNAAKTSPNKRTAQTVANKETLKTASNKPSAAKSKKKKKKSGLLKFFLVLILLVVLAGAAYFLFLGKDAADSDTPASDQTTEDSTADENTLSYSETFNDITISLINTTESTGGDLTTPSDGNIFYICEFEVTNNSANDITINSLSCIEAFCGDYSVSEDISGLLLPEADGKNSLDGTISAGQTFIGVVTYQIPEDYEQMQFRLSPDFWNGDTATFTVPKE